MQVKTSAIELAQQFADACAREGWHYSVSDSVVTIQKNFTPGDTDAYVACDMFAYGILELAPLKGGSVWGTDGGSIGGHAGLSGGYYRLNKSGTAKRFTTALAKIKARNF